MFYLSQLKELRSAKGLQHSLGVIVQVYLLAYLQEFCTQDSLEQFIKTNYEPLKKVLGVDKIPSCSTVWRTIFMLDDAHLEVLTNQWMKECIIPILDDYSTFAIDGKVLRSTVTDSNNNNQNCEMVMSVFSSGYIIYHNHYDKKTSNEVLEVKNYMKQIENQLVSLDAGHCGQPTIEAICENNNEFIIGLKRNRPSLFMSATLDCQAQVLSSYTQKKKGYTSEYEVYPCLNNQSTNEKVTSWVKVSTKWDKPKKDKKVIFVSESYRYYMTNTQFEAEKYAQIRIDHWTIENDLHRTKDMVFNEDKSRVKNHKHAKIRSIFTHIALNLLNHSGAKSIKYAIQNLKNRVEETFKLITLL